MPVLDEVIHQSTRLRIMTALNLLADDEFVNFVRLKALVEVSDGNLGAHLETLGRAGYVRVDKQFIGKKPQTMIFITAAGREAYLSHIAQLRLLLEL